MPAALLVFIKLGDLKGEGDTTVRPTGKENVSYSCSRSKTHF